MSTWILLIFGIHTDMPMQLISDLKSEQECVRVQQVMEKTLPLSFRTRCIEVIKKETK